MRYQSFSAGLGTKAFSVLIQISSLSLLILTLAVFNTRAQLPSGTIQGTVKDTSGAVVPGASVTARNTDTDQTRSLTSESDGTFRFNALAVGNYEVQVSAKGFQAALYSGLVLTVAQQVVVNVTLQVGTTSQTVTVTTETPLVNTTSGSLGGLVNEQNVADLPLNGRNYIDLALLQPGINEDKTRSAGEAAWFSSNGAPVISNYYLLDGTPTRNLYGRNPSSQSATVLGVDGVKEFRVISNNMSAEYGMSMGSELVVVSKSGTNNWHGDLYEYFRNSSLDARNYFDAPPSVIGKRLPPFRQNQFGASVGGPIQKDKTFFYATWESLHQRLGITSSANTLAPGCHGPANASIWNGIGVRPAGSLGPCAQVGPNPADPNPASPTLAYTVTINPVIAPLLALYPNPTPGLGQTLRFPFIQPLLENFGQLRLDHTFSEKDSVFGRFTTDVADQTEQVQPFPGFTDTPQTRNFYVTLGWTHVFDPNLLSTARFSWAGTRLATSGPLPYSGPQYSFVPGLPMGDLGVGGLSMFGPDIPIPLSERQYIWTWSDDVFYTRGRHSMKFGTLINRITQDPLGPALARGIIVFPNVSRFLQGRPVFQQALSPGSNWVRSYRNETYGFYFQDDWRATSRLTLNLGLRYEFNTVPRELRGREESLRNPLTDATITPGPLIENNTLHNFSPRFGFAWDVFGNGKTAVRGGFSILYDIDNLGASLITIALGQPPLSSFGFEQGPPPLTQLPLTFPTISNNLQLIDYHLKQPSMKQFNLTLERQLVWNTALTLTYAGSLGQHIFTSGAEGNPVVPGGVPVKVGGVESCVPRPTGQAANLTSMIDGNATACWLGDDSESRVNPNWGNIAYRTADGNSYYNSLQVLLSKQVSKGLQFQSSYTYSKSIDQLENVLGSDQTYTELSNRVDPFHAVTDRGPSVFDATHNWQFNLLYHFPAVHAEGFRGKALNGWWVAAIESLQTGAPFTACLENNQSNSQVSQGGNCLDRPNLVPGRSLGSITSGVSSGCTTPDGVIIPKGTPLGTPNLWFDPCAFSLPPAGFLGNEGRNILRGPGFANLDFTLAKDTKVGFLGEQGQVEFRSDFFNIANHPNFAWGNFCGGTNGTGLEAFAQGGGQICDTANNARQIQFALKVLF
jgi:hypothetical protein